jgi:hypothetical protein
MVRHAKPHGIPRRIFGFVVLLGFIAVLFGLAAVNVTLHGDRHHLATLFGASYLDDREVVFQLGRDDCARAAFRMVTGSSEQEASALVPVVRGRGATFATLLAALGRGRSPWRIVRTDAIGRTLPAIALMRWHHFVVVDAMGPGGVIVRDPALGRLRYDPRVFALLSAGWAAVPSRPHLKGHIHASTLDA